MGQSIGDGNAANYRFHQSVKDQDDQWADHQPNNHSINRQIPDPGQAPPEISFHQIDKILLDRRQTPVAEQPIPSTVKWHQQDELQGVYQIIQNAPAVHIFVEQAASPV